jgi:hypothetical protein
MILIYQPPNVHVRISGILQRNGGGGREKDLYRNARAVRDFKDFATQRNAMAVAAVKKIH